MRECVTMTSILVLCSAIAPLHAQLRLRPQVAGLVNPVAFVQDPAERGVQFAVQQNGHIRAVRGATVLDPDFLDLSAAIVSGGEQGLLGLVFAPDTATSGRFFVNFTNRSGDTVISRFRRTSSDVVADASSRFDLRWGGGQAFIAQP